MAQPTPSFHLSDFENLQEDLVLLQTSMEQHRVDPLRAQAQCADILAAVGEVSEEQGLNEYAKFVTLLTDFARDASDPQEALGPEFWSLTLDVLDELLAALEMGDAGLKVDEKAMRRHIATFETRLHELRQFVSASGRSPSRPGATPAAAADRAATAVTSESDDEQDARTADVTEDDAAVADTGEDIFELDEDDVAEFEEMQEPESEPESAPTPEPAGGAEVDDVEDAPFEEPTDSAGESEAAAVQVNDTDAQTLLEQATEAARAGRSGEAQRLAAAAATALAAQARRQKEAELQALQEELLQVEEQGAAIEANAKESERELQHHRTAIDGATAIRAEAEATLAGRAEALQNTKRDLEDVEERMGQLQATQQELIAQFEAALPAKEAAEQELQQATADVEALELSVRDAESRMKSLQGQLTALVERRAALQDRIAAAERDLQP